MLTEAPIIEVDIADRASSESTSGPSPYEFRAIFANEVKDGQRDIRTRAARSDEATRVDTEAVRRTAFEEGRREGERAARTAAEVANAAALAQERTRILAALDQFRAAQGQYFSAIEREVVRLALAIAARVLHREVQLDPLLLAGVTRVALEKLADRSSVVLRVPAKQESEWQKLFESLDAAERPAITANPFLAPGECILETQMGTVELGIAAQLEEIERGFFDLLCHRPAN